MELRHLRYFVAVAEELHFGRAAQRLHVAQPPLSQQIKALEEELQLRLFHRTSRRVELTAEGKVFLEHARGVLTQTVRATEMARAAGRGEAGRIAIGFVASAVYSFVPAILREFRQSRPRVELHCSEMRSIHQLKALQERELDVGFVRSPVREAGLETIQLCREPFVLVMPAEHPLSGEARVSLADFAKDTFLFISRNTSPVCHEITSEACRDAGFSPRLGQEVGELQTVLALVAAGLGVSLVPQSLRNWQRPGVVYRELRTHTRKMPLHVVWRSGTTEPLVAAFVATAEAVAKQELAGAGQRDGFDLAAGDAVAETVPMQIEPALIE